MSRPVRKTLFITIAILATLAVGYLYRDPLARTGVNYLLATPGMTVTGLHGLELAPRHVDIAGMELELPSGQQLFIRGVAVDFQDSAFYKAPVLQSVTVHSATVLPAIAGSQQEAGDSVTDAPVLLSDYLQLFRDIPDGDVVIRTLELPPWPQPLAVGLQKANGALDMRISSDAIVLTARLKPLSSASGLHLDLDVSLGDDSIATVQLALEPEQDGVALAGNGHIHLQVVALDSLLAGFGLAPTGLPLQSASLAWETTGKVADDIRGASVQVAIHDLELSGLPGWVPMPALDASVVVGPHALSFSTPLKLANAAVDPGIHVSGHFTYATGAADIELHMPTYAFRENGGALSDLVQGWPYPMDLLSGSLQADIVLTWPATSPGAFPQDKTVMVKAVLTDVAGFYGAIYFRGLNGGFDGSIAATDGFGVNTPPLSFSAARVDIGVPLDNLAIDFRLDAATQQVLVESFYAQTLGGTLTASQTSYAFNRERNPVTLLFSGLRLETLLDLVDYKGVQAFGAVSGELPLTLTAQGVEIAAGSLRADAPGGSIHYRGGAPAGESGNAGLDLVNRALGNYQYESLVSSIDYSPEGELLLSMQLQGFSPDLEDGRRINLNLDLSDNIPALLESLQALRAIEDFLEE